MAQTRLLYSFSPDKFSRSLGGDNRVDTLIDLVVEINPGGTAPRVDNIKINIPVGGSGDDAGNRLSAATKLPDPICDDTVRAVWKFEIDGSTITIKPKSGTNVTLASTIRFVLPRITVNETVGNVPITVTESAPTSIEANFLLIKQEANFPVTKFYPATLDGNELKPAVLFSFDRQVLLKWECSEQGKQPGYSYNLRTSAGETWQPKDCIDHHDCYSSQDGRVGVKTEKLKETTVFALDVIHTEGENRTVKNTLYLTVKVAVPRFLDGSCQQSLCFSSTVARLAWIAVDAVKCTIELDGRVIVDNAPLDTSDGYNVIVPRNPQPRQLSVTCHGVPGAKPFTQGFPDIYFPPLITIPVGLAAGRVAITPDGAKALVLGETPQPDGTQAQDTPEALKIIDIETSAVETIHTVPRTIANNGLFDLAITPDGTRAFATSAGGFSKIDLLNKRADPGPFLASEFPTATAMVNDSVGLFVGSNFGVWKTPIDQAHVPGGNYLSLRTDFDGEWVYYCVAVTPDGNLAVLSSGSRVNVIDLGQWGWRGLGITSADWVQNVAITPDGKFALASTYQGKVLVINIERQTIEKTIQLDNSSISNWTGVFGWPIAITPDGSVALIVISGKKRVDVFDIAKREIVSSFDAGNDPVHIAITPDGKRALMANYLSQNVTMTALPND